MGSYHAHAECLDCSWQSHANNAHGNGARHARAHRHIVLVTVERTYTYHGTSKGRAAHDRREIERLRGID